MAITSPGIGSNLDVNGIVSQLMSIERQPLAKINTQEASYQTKLSAVGSLKGVLSSLQSSLSALTKPATFAGSYKASSSDSTAVSASASDKANNGSYSVSVTTLAQAQKLRTANTFSGVNASIGSGKITIQFGTTTATDNSAGTFVANGDKAATTITIDPSKSSLLDVRDAINKANAGVTASIVNDGSGYRLAISANDTGAANSLKITVDDDDLGDTDSTGLSALAFDPTTAGPRNLLISQAAMNAIFTIDGIPIVKASNTVTDAIEGVTLNLLKEGGSSNVAVSFDRSSIASSVQAFVKAYNEANKALRELGAYNAETKVAGPLQGDAIVRTVQGQLAAALRGNLTYSAGGLSNLTQIGLTFNRDGSLALDQGKLTSATNDPAKDIATLFTSVGKATDSGVTVVSASSKLQTGNYSVSVSQLATQGNSTSALSSGTITAGVNDSLSLSIDGISVSVALAAGTYTDAALAAEIQSKVNGYSSLKNAGSSVSVGITQTDAVATASDAADWSAVNALASADTFDITIGTETKTISIGPGTTYADADELAEDLEAKINAAFGGGAYAVTVGSDAGGVLSINTSGLIGPASVSNGSGAGVVDSIFGVGGVTGLAGTASLSFTSAKYGSASKVNSISNPLISGTTSTDGIDIAGKIGSADATGSGQELTAQGPAEGLKVKIASGSLGDRGAVAYEKGFAQRLSDMLSALVSNDGVLSSKTKSIQTSVNALDDRREAIGRRLVQIEARYRRQFNSLDTLMSQMTQTSNYLSQQLGRLNATSNG